MNEIADLFHHHEMRLGVFYPTEYIVAIFGSFDAARSAHEALLHAGLTDEESHPARGSEVLDYFDQLSEETGVWGRLMTEFSRVIDTEAAFVDFVDNDIRQAQRGAGFLFVRCLNDHDAERIRELVLPCRPIAMQWYTAGAVQSMV
jgi:hypothetical protein